MAINMGLNWANGAGRVFKRKFRWLFFVDGIVDDGVNALPPDKASRPSLSFKEQSFEHLNETIYFPIKPEWKTFSLSIFDVKCKFWPVWDNWLKDFYNPEDGSYLPPIDAGYKKDARLELYDGCGEIIEKWKFEKAYPSELDFENLDMSDNGILHINLTLRYDRAYLQKN
jgi:hypothetical protein